MEPANLEDFFFLIINLKDLSLEFLSSSSATFTVIATEDAKKKRGGEKKIIKISFAVRL